MTAALDNRRHNGPARYPSAPEHIRFFRHTRESETSFDGLPCWEWTAARYAEGYGQFTLQGGRAVRAHQWSYRYFRAEVPAGLQLDHLCRNRPCCNPWHLEPVTPLVNTQRGEGNGSRTHCPQGHPYDEQNTYRTPQGRRLCRACAQERQYTVRDDQHGSVTGYKYGCRCDACRAAHGAYQAAYYAKRQGRTA